jgi:hypothetical protein
MVHRDWHALVFRFVVHYANGDSIAVAASSGLEDLCSNRRAHPQLLGTFSH